MTADRLREIDGWTPENKAVFETVARLKQGLAEGMPTGELVDVLADLGIGERDARAFGFIPEGNRYVGDALAVANNGTRALQNAVGDGGPGHIPLEIAAEVARSVNAGTTGLMPQELGRRPAAVQPGAGCPQGERRGEVRGGGRGIDGGEERWYTCRCGSKTADGGDARAGVWRAEASALHQGRSRRLRRNGT
ncbi:MAG: hypothetical protein IJ658_05100 [Kiritimatiellae bacterium]|nr:hypothetical protein [Kiritimatiellia bacterium]